MDDSGTHAGSQAVTVAGYLSVDPNWQDFEVEWRRSLEIYGLEYFHMTDFASRVGPYKNWRIEQCAPRLNKLIDIINEHAGVGVGAVIPMWLYEEALSDEQKKACGHAYCVAALGCFIQVAQWLKSIHQEAEIAYVVEQGTQGSAHVKRIFDSMYSREVDRKLYGLLSIRFEDKKRFVPLQAADILAFELHKHLPRMLGKDGRPARTRNLHRLDRVPVSLWGWPDAPKMRQIADVLVKEFNRDVAPG